MVAYMPQIAQLAAQKIPEFFFKAMDSSVEPARFRALAHEVARTHHVGDGEFRNLAIKGLVGSTKSHTMIDCSGI
jgi:hypothetical protein